MAEELTEFEVKLLKWLIKSDFHIQPWSTKDAAKAFKVSEDEVYDAVAALSKRPPTRSKSSTKTGPFTSQRTEFIHARRGCSSSSAWGA
ncbi:MAG: hypothetical protein CM15mP78_15480 [Candidatus Poseidoniales archaeon]|nr:MAG: hypothetical protein CM15mP78_15480 [Candidatus Poseidoniales archaeon]